MMVKKLLVRLTALANVLISVSPESSIDRYFQFLLQVSLMCQTQLIKINQTSLFYAILPNCLVIVVHFWNLFIKMSLNVLKL